MELIPPGTKEVKPKTAVFGPHSPVGSAVGKQFQEYRIVEELGRGGMGVVYKAMQETLQRLVALKLILAGECASDEEIENFLREAMTAAKLRHPNIVSVHELDVHEGIYYYTMDYIEGKDLGKLVSDQGMEPRRAVIIALKVARALSHAHKKGVVHRDLKPGNIIVDEQGEPMVTDFGLALDLERFGRQGLAMAGTPLYMAPEQLAGNRALVGPHSDIYALGVVMYEMLIGRLPFEGRNLNELLDDISRRESPDPRQRRPDLDAEIAGVCLKCLRKKTEERYGSAAELAEELASWLTQKH
jgi:serine/threonine protein kinase